MDSSANNNTLLCSASAAGSTASCWRSIGSGACSRRKTLSRGRFSPGRRLRARPTERTEIQVDRVRLLGIGIVLLEQRRISIDVNLVLGRYELHRAQPAEATFVQVLIVRQYLDHLLARVVVAQ